MQVIIHCGLDKAGSTAIQAHVALFRQWLLGKGIYVPSAGLSGFGHVALFRDLEPEGWRPLLDELAELDKSRFSRCFLSYEGICKFDLESLGLIRKYLRDHEVTVLFYLREQAEILQSGYLQQLKSEKHPLSIAHLNSDHALLVPASRDYDRLLQKFESVFGRDSIAVRVYQPLRWRDASIVWDLLEFFDCSPDSLFSPATQSQNVSLDAQAARILNLFDSYSDDSSGRAALVEDLLWLIQKYPGGSKYFLEEAAVQCIRDHYHRSNMALAERYGIEFDYRPCVAEPSGRPADVGSKGRVSYVEKLADLAHYPRWKGEQLRGMELSTLLRNGSGWSRFESWGVWSLGDTSQIEFRLPMSRFTGLEESFVLAFRGRYFAGNASTQVRVNGHVIEDTDLREAEIRVPFRLLDEQRIVRLQLRHHSAVSPADLATGDDKRRLAYGLQDLSYRLLRPG